MTWSTTLSIGVALLSVVLLGACSTSGETPSDAAHESAPAAGRLVAASDCRASSRSVRVRGTLPAGSLVATSDSTGTGLLVTNTSQWTMLMVPAETSTVIEEAPYSNPTDTASRLALDAVARADLPHIDPEWPTGYAQVFIVPPKWSICALAPLGHYAAIDAARDKSATAAYFFALRLAQGAVKLVTPAALSRAQTFVTCAKGVVSALTAPLPSDPVDLYTTAVSDGTSCYSSYRTLFRTDEQAETTAGRVMKNLGKTPRLLQDAEFLEILLHR